MDTAKNKINRNVVCPFCRHPVDKEIPPGLALKEIVKTAKEIIKKLEESQQK